MKNETLGPKPAAVEEMFTDLIGRKVTVKQGTPVAPSPKSPAILGVFGPAEGPATAIAVCDIALAANLGAALSMLPPDSVEESLSARKLSEGLMKNFREVLNVMKTMLDDPSKPPNMLKAVQSMPGVMPKDAYQAAARPALRVDFEVQIAGYGGGSISILLA